MPAPTPQGITPKPRAKRSVKSRPLPPPSLKPSPLPTLAGIFMLALILAIIGIAWRASILRDVRRELDVRLPSATSSASNTYSTESRLLLLNLIKDKIDQQVSTLKQATSSVVLAGATTTTTQNPATLRAECDTKSTAQAAATTTILLTDIASDFTLAIPFSETWNRPGEASIDPFVGPLDDSNDPGSVFPFYTQRYRFGPEDTVWSPVDTCWVTRPYAVLDAPARSASAAIRSFIPPTIQNARINRTPIMRVIGRLVYVKGRWQSPDHGIIPMIEIIRPEGNLVLAAAGSKNPDRDMAILERVAQSFRK